MANLDSAWRDAWRGIYSTVPLNPDAAIYKEWQVHYQQWGSPLGPERPLDSGGVYQIFASAIVKWTPEDGVQVIS
jgi:hypothetical protein